MIRLQFIIVLCFGVLLFAGCARPTSLPRKAPEVKAGELPVITVIAGGTESYWLEAKRGAIAAGKKLGAKIVWKVPVGNDVVASQKQLMKDATPGSHGIVLAPADSTKLMQPVGDAALAGLAVVVFDRDVYTLQNKLSYVHNDDEASGGLAAHEMGKKHGARVGVLEPAPEDAAATSRMRAFEDTMHQEFSDVPLDRIGELPVKGITALFAPNDARTREIFSSYYSKLDDVIFAKNNLYVEAGKRGEIAALITPDYYQMAYQSVKAILDYRALKYPPREIKIAPRVITKSTKTNNQRSTR